ncbi:hypothetical protein P2318_21735 [Myxococcaceae bacterium GXIMD 01537]
MAHLTGGAWAWGQRARNRIHDLRTLMDFMADRSEDRENADKIRSSTFAELARANELLGNSRPRPWRVGAIIDGVEAACDNAFCQVLRVMPLKDLRGWLPELYSLTEDILPPSHAQHESLDDIWRKLFKDKTPGAKASLRKEDRETIVTAVSKALNTKQIDYIRCRSFRNIVLGVSFTLLVLATLLAGVTAARPHWMPLCFEPKGEVICPTASRSDSFQQSDRPQRAMFSLQTPEPPPTNEARLQDLAKPWDFVVVEFIGLISAAVAGAATLRKVRGTALPYSIPLALALLKLPTGALTAVLGLLMMRGAFVPGLSALDSPAQIIAWAIVFGYAQQLVTRLVDEKGKSVIDSVGGEENPIPPEQRVALKSN